jgi:DUF3096 family protein
MSGITTVGAICHEGAARIPVDRGRNSFIVGRRENPAERFEAVSIVFGQTQTESLMDMHLSLSLAPLVALIAGILILVMPRLLNYIVALYLIVTGLLGLFGGGPPLHFR